MDDLFENNVKYGAKIGDKITVETYVNDILIYADDMYVQHVDGEIVRLHDPKNDMGFYGSYWHIENGFINDKFVSVYLDEIYN